MLLGVQDKFKTKIIKFDTFKFKKPIREPNLIISFKK